MELVNPAEIRYRFSKWLSHGHDEIIIFSPFFSMDGFNLIDSNVPSKTQIKLQIRGRAQDFLMGSTSIDAIKMASNSNWEVRFHHNLHAKIYRSNENSGFYGSSNLTKRGFSSLPFGNFEVLSFKESFPQYYLNILNDFWECSEDFKPYIESVCKYLDQNESIMEKLDKSVDPTVKVDPNRKSYSLLDIPQSKSLKAFHSVLALESDLDKVQIHDFELLNSFKNMSFEKVCLNFNRIPLVSAFLHYLDEGRYFGDLRRWLVDKVEDVPTPSREDFNTQLNKLYDLVIEANPGMYERVTPGARSEMLRKITYDN